MAVRGRAAAIAAFLSPLQQSISCVTPAVLLQGYAGPNRSHAMTFPQRYVSLRGRHELDFSVLHEYELAADPDGAAAWTVQTSGYWYQLRQSNGPEILAFHWHPNVGRGQIPSPHLHLGLPTASIDIGGKRHIPTGRVAIEAVVRFLIQEVQVRPLRADWQDVLDRNEPAVSARKGE